MHLNDPFGAINQTKEKEEEENNSNIQFNYNVANWPTISVYSENE